MMNIFKDMVNHCIEIGLENNITSMKKLSLLSYNELSKYDILSYYKLNAISHAAGRLLTGDILSRRESKQNHLL